MQVYEMIANERRALADVFDKLTPEQLRTPSLCDGWTIHDIAAHLIMPLETGIPTLALSVLASGGDFDKANLKLTGRHARRPITDLVDSLRHNAGHRFKPPGMGPEAPLTELLLHGQDVRRPLGIDREFCEERMTMSLRFLTERRFRGWVPKGLLDGLAFEATDLDWSYGTGATVRGSAEALLMAISGRRASLRDLQGDGVAVLQERLV
jgi:uncharacterized protein (TIGR03083 family)